MPFVGHYRHTLDEKNRVRLPSKFRAELSSVMFIAPGRTNCLYLYPGEEQLNNRAAEFETETIYSDDAENDAATIFWSSVEEIREDQQGRILIRDDIKKIAGISKDIVFVGRRDFIEIWPAEEYDRRCGGVLDPKKVSQLLAQLKNRGN